MIYFIPKMGRRLFFRGKTILVFVLFFDVKCLPQDKPIFVCKIVNIVIIIDSASQGLT